MPISVCATISKTALPTSLKRHQPAIFHLLSAIHHLALPYLIYAYQGRHMMFKQYGINVNATLWSCINIDPTLISGIWSGSALFILQRLVRVYFDLSKFTEIHSGNNQHTTNRNGQKKFPTTISEPFESLLILRIHNQIRNSQQHFWTITNIQEDFRELKVNFWQ